MDDRSRVINKLDFS